MKAFRGTARARTDLIEKVHVINHEHVDIFLETDDTKVEEGVFHNFHGATLVLEGTEGNVGIPGEDAERGHAKEIDNAGQEVVGATGFGF